MKSKIYILSKGRSTLTGFTVEQMYVFAPKRRGDVFLVVPPEEEASYRLLAERYDLGGVITCPRKGVPATRQFIADFASSRYVFMLADDIRFYRRVGMQIRGVRDQELDEMFDELEKDLGRCDHVSLSTKDRAYYQRDYNGQTKDYNAKTFADVLGYRRRAFRSIRFDVMPSLEEYYVAISLLKQGRRTLTRYDWSFLRVVDHIPGGKVNKDRTQGKQKLIDLHPDVVSWRGKNFYVRWKEAYAHCDTELQPTKNQDGEGVA